MTWLKKYQSYILTIIIGFLYFFFAYKLERTSFTTVFLLYISLFSFSFLLYKNRKEHFSFLLWSGILFRFIFIIAIPNLSQDFYRFIWDGRLLFEGLNPYLSTPENFINQAIFPIENARELYRGMGTFNGSHFTNYPPLNQFCFLIAAIVSKSSILGAVITMRVQIIFADLGILYFGKKILKLLKLPVQNIFWYFLDPFIIIELTGNLHYESVMLFFLFFSLYLLLKKKWIWSAVILGLSVSVKLIPLLFIPILFQSFYKKGKSRIIQFLLYGAIVIGVNLLLFLPFTSKELISNYTSSVGLWFQKFEFNASLYYVAREIGYLFRGYNEIAIIGKIMPILATVFILIISFVRNNKKGRQLFTALLLGISFYYFTTTTIHPWYLSTLVLLCVFTKYKFPLVWSLAIILSYQAYANSNYQENYWLIGLEYLFVYSFLIWDIYKSNNSINRFNR